MVIRKKKPILITEGEKNVLYKAVEILSDLKDFFIHTEEDYIYLYHAQFNYIAGTEENLTRQQAIEIFGDTIEHWMKFNTAFRCKLVNYDKRFFQAERIVYTGFYEHTFHPISAIDTLENLANQYAPYLGRATFFDLEPVGQ